MSVTLTEKIYKYYRPKDSGRSATIKFASDGNEWHFKGCSFNVFNDKVYDIDDWEFLRDLGNEVLRLCEEVK